MVHIFQAFLCYSRRYAYGCDSARLGDYNICSGAAVRSELVVEDKLRELCTAVSLVLAQSGTT